MIFDPDHDGDVLALDCLATAFPDLAADLNGCGGVLVAVIGPNRAVFVFREEISQSVHWAGRPDKAVEAQGDRMRISPRRSFAAYRQQVHGRCKPWSDEDIQFIRYVRALLHAAERQSLLDKLTRQQALMIGELTHRVRNILALVQSVSRQSRRRHGSVDGYADAVESRIRALASTHDLFAGSAQSTASLKSLIRKAFEPYQTLDNARVNICGPDQFLRGQITSIVSLVVHELTTNAVKYGALSVPEGRVHVPLDAVADAIRMTWLARGGPAAHAPNEAGFGTRLIEQAVPHELGGTALLEFEDDGVRAVFTLPKVYFGPPQPEDTSEPEVPTLINAPPAPSKGISGRAMVLEDNFIIAQEVASQLEEFWFGSTEVFSGVDGALDFLQDQQVDFAMLDANLGEGRSSVPVAMALRERGLPFLFVTGYGDSVASDPCLADVPCLRKPICADTLEAIIREVLCRGRPPTAQF